MMKSNMFLQVPTAKFNHTLKYTRDYQRLPGDAAARNFTSLLSSSLRG